MHDEYPHPYVYRLETGSDVLGTQMAGLLSTDATCGHIDDYEGRRMVHEDAELARKGLPYPDDPEMKKRRVYFFTSEDACISSKSNTTEFEKNIHGRYLLRIPHVFLAEASHFPDVTPHAEAMMAVFDDYPSELSVAPPNVIDIKMKDGTWKRLTEVELPTEKLDPFSRSGG